MPRHSCRGALFWSFRYGYATLLESWRHSLPHVQPADPAGRRCRVAVLPPAASKPGEKTPARTEQAFLFGVLGALVGAKFLYLLLQLPQLLQDLPLLAADPAAFPPLPLGWVRLLWRAVRRSGRGLAVLPVAQGPLLPAGGRPGPRRPPVPHLWPGGLLPGRVLLRAFPPPPGWPGVTFRVSPVAPNGVRSPRPADMRPPVACFFFFCCTAWPGGAGRERPFCWSIWAIYAPVPLRPGISSGRCGPGDVGGIFHLSAAGSGYSGRCPPPPDPPSPYVRQTAAPVTHRPRLFFVSAPPPPLRQEPASWNRLSKSYVERKSRNASIRGAISWAVIGSSSRSRRVSSWHTSGE